MISEPSQANKILCDSWKEVAARARERANAEAESAAFADVFRGGMVLPRTFDAIGKLRGARARASGRARCHSARAARGQPLGADRHLCRPEDRGGSASGQRRRHRAPARARSWARRTASAAGTVGTPPRQGRCGGSAGGRAAPTTGRRPPAMAAGACTIRSRARSCCRLCSLPRTVTVRAPPSCLRRRSRAGAAARARA